MRFCDAAIKEGESQEVLAADMTNNTHLSLSSNPVR